jgi:galactan endo-1,6-beta-galactosidase
VGLENLTIAASDENKNREAIDTWITLATAQTPENTAGGARALVGQINVHAYGVDMRGTSWHREELYKEIGTSRKIWMSEYGEHDGSGWLLATNLNLDFRWLRPSAWCLWQLLDETGGWGLIRARLEGRPEIQEVNVKYWIFAHYSRHIRPGMDIIPCGNDWCVAAHDPQARRLVLVQQSDERTRTTITYDLSRFSAVRGPVMHWVTAVQGSDRYAKDESLQITGRSLIVHLDPLTIHTIEIEGVEMGAVDAGKN